MSGTVEHDESSEFRQQPSGEPWWQDSVSIVWHADEAGIGGYIRIGHEYDSDPRGPVVALWFGLVTEDGLRYRRNTSEPMVDGDRLDLGFGAQGGDYSITFENGRLRHRVTDEDCAVDLAVEDFYPRTDFFPATAGSLVEEFAAAHFECSGRITGHVRLGENEYEVDGLCHRDHSWGVRRWDTLLNHRWTPGTVGPELSFGAISWHSVDGAVRRFGYVVRDGVVTHAEEIDTVVTFEADGVGARSGRTVWRFADGEEMVLDCVPIDGILFTQHEVASVDNICAIEIDGRRGFCDLEVSTNPRGGTAAVTSAIGAITTDGLSRRPSPTAAGA